MKKKILFAMDFIVYALKGGPRYYAWLLSLSFFVLIMTFMAYRQFTDGLIVTGLNDQITWGVYLANFVFLVGVAAAAVTVVFPSYIYKHKHLKEIVVLGEMLAISACTMCLIFVIFHMGRPDRTWHMIPVIGIFNWPNSMLTWDVIVLNGYLILNAICAFYYLYKKYTGQELNYTFYKSIVFISIFWAVSIHTVTAFLLGTMAARPMWFHSMMPVRFLATAFAAGPALIIIVFLNIRKSTKLVIHDKAIDLLAEIVVWCLGIALFLTFSEIVTELYPGTEHSYSLQYLMFGMHGLNKLVPWFWMSLVLMISAFIMLLNPRLRKDYQRYLPIACMMSFAGIWIEKGLGLLVPGFIPSPIGEFVEYSPSWVEIFNSLGGWAFGLIIYTLLTKGAIGVLLGEVAYSVRKTHPHKVRAEKSPALSVVRD